jgi:hypothetical protein
LLRTRQNRSAAPVSGLSDHEGTLSAFMIVREDTGSPAALPARCFARASITAPRVVATPMTITYRYDLIALTPPFTPTGPLFADAAYLLSITMAPHR